MHHAELLPFCEEATNFFFLLQRRGGRYSRHSSRAKIPVTEASFLCHKWRISTLIFSLEI